MGKRIYLFISVTSSWGEEEILGFISTYKNSFPLCCPLTNHPMSACSCSELREVSARSVCPTILTVRVIVVVTWWGFWVLTCFPPFLFLLPWVTWCCPQEVSQIYLLLSKSACAVALRRAEGRRKMPTFVEVPTGHSPPTGYFPSFRKPALMHSHFYRDHCISSHPLSNIQGEQEPYAFSNIGSSIQEGDVHIFWKPEICWPARKAFPVECNKYY